jgi:ABC-type nitrate/sulfonate/bicarbonate transport system substrate-binding protein
MVKIGMVQDNFNMLDHHVALARGHYRDQGLDVELVAPPRPEAIQTLTSGEVPVSSFTSAVMDAILRDGAPFKFVLFTRNGVPHHIVARPGIRTVRDLKGKTLLAGGEGGTNYYMTLDWLRDNGLEPNVDVRIVSPENASFSDFFGSTSTPAWVRGALRWAADAALCGGFERFFLMQEFGFHSLVDLPDVYPGRMIHGLAAHVATLEKEPDLVRRVVAAHVAAAGTIREDRAWCVPFIAQKWGVAERVAAEGWEMMRPRFIAEIEPGLLEPEIAYFRAHIERGDPQRRIMPPRVESLVDRSFFDEIQRAGRPQVGPVPAPAGTRRWS